MNLIEECLKIAIFAHKGQIDKLGKPYILHPLTVMQSVNKYGDDAMCVAILHDVIEDTKVDRFHLVCSGIDNHIIKSIEVLTKIKDESYTDYIDRIILSNDRNSLLVKRADLMHNLSKERSSGLPKGKKPVYEKSLLLIEEALQNLTA